MQIVLFIFYVFDKKPINELNNKINNTLIENIIAHHTYTTPFHNHIQKKP